jgi:hypothetical protein
MPQKLAIGSFGQDVVQLQNSLNLLPTSLPALVPDGSFGNKTKTRTVEFQNQSFLQPDGIVDPITWAKLLELISGLLPPGVDTPPLLPPPVDSTVAKRLEVVAIARAEAEQNPLGMLAAKLPGGKDPSNNRTFRRGHDNLLKYFRMAAPNPANPGTTFYNENDITYLTEANQLGPMRDWCGIFALWVYKMAGLPVGSWRDGFGIGSVAGIKQNFQKKGDLRGCIGFINAFQHHFIIEDVFTSDLGIKMVKTVEGNSGPSSNFNIRSTPSEARQLQQILVYTPFPISG